MVSDTEDLLLHQDKKLNDRANWIIAAQSFLFGGIATLLSDFKLTGWLLTVPGIICFIGVLINVFWGISNGNQIRNTRQSLNMLTNKAKTSGIIFSTLLKDSDKNKPKFTDFISNWMPFALALGWIFILTFYILYIFLPI